MFAEGLVRDSKAQSQERAKQGKGTTLQTTLCPYNRNAATCT